MTLSLDHSIRILSLLDERCIRNFEFGDYDVHDMATLGNRSILIVMKDKVKVKDTQLVEN